MSPSPPNHRRVAITGLGVVSPLGNSPSALWEALSAGRSGVAALKNFPPLEGQVEFGGEASDFTGAIDDFGPLPKPVKKSIRKALKVMCRETMMGVAVAQQAYHDSGLADAAADPERSGVVFGSDYMLSPPEDLNDGMIECGIAQGALQYSRWGQDGLREMSPLWMLKYLPNMPASHIAIFNDLRGPNNSLTLREIAGLMAIREAVHTIQRGQADRMLAGATGTRLHPFKTVHALQQVCLAQADLDPETASRPFDKNRTGMVVGEGAAALMLEELGSAQARGATIYGEVLGSGSSMVANGELQGRCDRALANAATTALRESGLTGDRLGHVNAHGLATVEADAAEAVAIGEVLGDSNRRVPVVAAKSYFGHLGAASSVVELIASLGSLGEQQLFRTLNYQTPDPQCPVAVTTDHGQPSGENFLKLSVTPQGQAAALVVARTG